MARKFAVTFQGAQGSVAKVTDLKGNVAVVKFSRRRSAKLFPGSFGGVLVKASKKDGERHV